MSQAELIKKLFDSEFITDLDLNCINELYNLSAKSIPVEDYLGSEGFLKYEEELNKLISRTTEDYFKAGVDCTLALLGYEPAFNKEK